MFDFEVLSVGARKEEFALGYDACFARIDALGVLTICVLIDNPTAEMRKKASIDNYGMHISAYACENVLTIAVKPGLLPWHDAPYNPWCEGLSNLPVPRLLPQGDGIMCNYALVDSRDGQILDIKAFGLGTDLSNYVLAEQYKLSHDAFDIRVFYGAVQRIQRKYSPWEIGVKLRQASYFYHPKE